MTLYHTTPTVNVPSILQTGIDPRRSEGKIIAAWLHTPSRNTWAVQHTTKRHHTTDVTTLTVNVPRTWLTRRQRGIWTCDHVISPRRIKQ
mgnify:CR=1 FL=1